MTYRIALVLMTVASLCGASPSGNLAFEGRVIDARNQPIAGATVTLTALPGDGERTTETDARGRFRFAALAGGRYHIRAEAAGYLPDDRVQALAASVAGFELRLRQVTIESEIVVSSSLPELATALELTAADVAAAGGDDLAAVLRGVPGLSAVRRGPVNLEPTLRGLQEEQVGMFVNGTRTFAAGPARMDSNVSHVNPHAVDGVRVVKGPYALTWGAGTLSALRVDTFRPPLGADDVRGSFDLGYGGNAGAVDAFGNVWHGHDRWTWVLDFAHRAGDDYEAGDGSEVPADYESSTFRSAWAVEVRDDLLWTFDWSYQEQHDLDYPGRLLDATYFYTRSYATDLTWSGEGAVREVYGQLYVNRKDHRMNNDEKPTARPVPGRVPPFAIAVDLPTESNTRGGRVRVALDGGRTSSLVGVDYYEMTQSATRTISRRDDGRVLFTDAVWPDATIEDLGAYAQTTWRTGRARLGATVRLDAVDAAAGELSPFFAAHTAGDPDRSETHVSAALSALFELGPHWSLEAGVGRAVRTATVLERYSDRFPSTKFQLAAEFMGNPELEAEKSLEWNLGARGRWGGFLLEVEGFYRVIDDYVTVSPDPDLTRRLPLSPPLVYRYVNGGEATFYGGELVARHRVDPRLSWRGALSYVWAEDEAFGEPVLGIPPLGGALGLRYHGLEDRLWIDLTGRFADRQDRVATSRFEQATAGYAVLDLAARLELASGWHFRAGVDNLTDRAYAHHLNSPNPFTGERIPEIGRSFHVGLGLRFSKKPPRLGRGGG